MDLAATNSGGSRREIARDLTGARRDFGRHRRAERQLPDFGTPPTRRSARAARRSSGAASCSSCATPASSSTIPQLTEYIGSLGSQLASHANNGDFKFHFFLVKDDQINAFALPGGFVGMNSGLMLATKTRTSSPACSRTRSRTSRNGTSRARCTTTSARASCRWPRCSPRCCSARPPTWAARRWPA